MPIYEYRCGNGHTFEVMQSFSDDPVVECQTCALPVEKVFHPVAVHFKGKGFYNTDYGTRKRAREGRESSEGGSGDSGAEANGASGKSDSGKSDSGKGDSGNSDSGKSGSGKSDSGKGDSGKGDSGAATAKRGSGASSARSSGD